MASNRRRQSACVVRLIPRGDHHSRVVHCLRIHILKAIARLVCHVVVRSW